MLLNCAHSVQNVLDFAVSYLNQQKSCSTWTPQDLLASVLKVDRSELLLQASRLLLNSESNLFFKNIERYAQGEPLAYILGEVSFYGCDLQITKNVLIPRPETEILVDLIVNQVQREKLDLPFQIWDVGCGSGCIGLALAKAFPQSQVVLSDFCPKALSVAQINAIKNELSVEFVLGDLLIPFEEKEPADVLVCNPPYLSNKEYEEADRSVKDFEPRMALVGGERGDEFYERLAKEARSCLQKDGKVFLEIGWLQGKKVKEIFLDYSWENVEIVKDWSQKDRFCIAN